MQDDEQKLNLSTKLKGKSSAQQYMTKLHLNKEQKQQDDRARAKLRSDNVLQWEQKVWRSKKLKQELKPR